jgi:hypothetical protein
MTGRSKGVDNGERIEDRRENLVSPVDNFVDSVDM